MVHQEMLVFLVEEDLQELRLHIIKVDSIAPNI